MRTENCIEVKKRAETELYIRDKKVKSAVSQMLAALFSGDGGIRTRVPLRAT